MSKWENYGTGRRPDKNSLITETVPYIYEWGVHKADFYIGVGKEEIVQELSKLSTPMLATLLEAFVNIESQLD